MRKLLATFLLLVSFTATSSENIREKAIQLRESTQTLLGISPKALSFLLHTKPGSHYPLEIYKQIGDYKYFEELERSGYATIKVVGGLPDKTTSEAMARLIPTDKGQRVRCVLLQ